VLQNVIVGEVALRFSSKSSDRSRDCTEIQIQNKTKSQQTTKESFYFLSVKTIQIELIATILLKNVERFCPNSKS
jgi:hypothetical protein